MQWLDSGPMKTLLAMYNDLSFGRVVREFDKALQVFDVSVRFNLYLCSAGIERG